MSSEAKQGVEVSESPERRVYVCGNRRCSDYGAQQYALAEYERATAPARIEYERAKALAFAKSYLVPAAKPGDIYTEVAETFT